jgi:hypothetical protein
VKLDGRGTSDPDNDPLSGFAPYLQAVPVTILP